MKLSSFTIDNVLKSNMFGWSVLSRGALGPGFNSESDLAVSITVIRDVQSSLASAMDTSSSINFITEDRAD